MESEYEKKLNIFVEAVIRHEVDIVSLQEVMQPVNAAISDFAHINCGKIPLKVGNHALNVINALGKKGLKYNLAWLGFKRSYDKFDEGIAIITPHEIIDTESVALTKFDDYYNWKTRRALAINVLGMWFYSVHFGWWEGFVEEFENLSKSTQGKRCVWLMGDFNSVASERGKGYDLVVNNGWYDTYQLALNKDDGITANTGIDGWGEGNVNIRIDYIFTNKKRKIQSSFVIFNGINEEVVSDHFGIILTTGKEEK